MITYWSKLINGKDKKYAKLLYDLGFKLQQENRGNIGWFENIKSIQIIADFLIFGWSKQHIVRNG